MYVQGKCYKCGGFMAVDGSEDASVCPFCGKPFIVEKAIQNFNDTAPHDIDVEKASYDYDSDFVVERSVLIRYNGYTKKDVRIPDGITVIGESAFQGMNNIESVYIPDGAELISEGAFSGCKNLQAIHIPDSLITIDREAFNGCMRLKNINFPDNLKNIEAGAFIGCTSLEAVTLPKELEILPWRIFEDCTGLKYVFIPKKIKTIEDYAFAECTSLEEVKFESLHYDDGTSEGIFRIGMNAFKNCKNLSSITIPASTKTIAHNAFSIANGLRSVEFEMNSRLETIGDTAFVGCESLSSITIPASVTSVGSSIFFGCDNLFVHYIGTLTEWKSIAKENWDEGWNNKFHCTRHSITKATPEAFGEEKAYCPECHDYILKSTAIEKPEQYQLSADSYTYDGSEKTPDVTVTDSAGEVIDAVNYDVTYSGNVDPGTATATVTFKGDYYTGSKDLTFTIARAPIADASVDGVTSRTYNGKAQTQTPVVKSGDRILLNGTDYKLSYKSNKNAGTATMTTTGIGNYTGTKSTTFTINKAANPLKIKAKTATVKGSTKGKKGTLKKTKKLAVTKVIKLTNKGQGAKTYIKKSGNKKITIAKKTGKVTVKKGLKKGTYKVKVKVKAAGDANYNPSAWKVVTCKIKVK